MALRPYKSKLWDVLDYVTIITPMMGLSLMG
jgi:hypothetical protein